MRRGGETLWEPSDPGRSSDPGNLWHGTAGILATLTRVPFAEYLGAGGQHAFLEGDGVFGASRPLVGHGEVRTRGQGVGVVLPGTRRPDWPAR